MATGRDRSSSGLARRQNRDGKEPQRCIFSLNYGLANKRKKGIGLASAGGVNDTGTERIFVNTNKGQYHLMDPNKSSVAENVAFIGE
jgi:hypothetical protein